MVSLRRLCIAPIVATITFLALYVTSALLYPGGSRSHPDHIGFSFRDNYWCDILDRTTYGGKPNPGASIALGATIVLSFGLAVLWWTAPTLFPKARRRALIVRGAGIVSCVLTPFISTSYHNLAINIAGGLGMLALVTTISALRASEGTSFMALGVLNLIASAANFVMWRTGWALAQLPVLQKAAFMIFLAWVLALAFRVRTQSKEPKVP